MGEFDLHRTNINLRKGDVEYLQKKHGYGWTKTIQEVVSKYVKERKDHERQLVTKRICPDCRGTGESCFVCGGKGILE